MPPCPVRLYIANERALSLQTSLRSVQALFVRVLQSRALRDLCALETVLQADLWGFRCVCFSSMRSICIGPCLTVLLVGIWKHFRQLDAVFSMSLIMDRNDLFK